MPAPSASAAFDILPSTIGTTLRRVGGGVVEVSIDKIENALPSGHRGITANRGLRAPWGKRLVSVEIVVTNEADRAFPEGLGEVPCQVFDRAGHAYGLDSAMTAGANGGDRGTPAIPARYLFPVVLVFPVNRSATVTTLRIGPWPRVTGQSQVWRLA